MTGHDTTADPVPTARRLVVALVLVVAVLAVSTAFLTVFAATLGLPRNTGSHARPVHDLVVASVLLAACLVAERDYRLRNLAVAFGLLGCVGLVRATEAAAHRSPAGTVEGLLWTLAGTVTVLAWQIRGNDPYALLFRAWRRRRRTTEADLTPTGGTTFPP